MSLVGLGHLGRLHWQHLAPYHVRLGKPLVEPKQRSGAGQGLQADGARTGTMDMEVGAASVEREELGAELVLAAQQALGWEILQRNRLGCFLQFSLKDLEGAEL